MHTWESSAVQGPVIRIHHNGDYSGDVKMIVPTETVKVFRKDFADDPELYEVELPFEVLRNFILEYQREKMIGQMENMDYDELDSFQALWEV